MSMAETLVPTRTAPPQSSARDTRVKDDGSAGSAATGSEDDSFRDVMSDLADRAEMKRDGASGKSAGAERTGGPDRPGSKEAAGGSGDSLGETSAVGAVPLAGGEASALPPGSLLAQFALVLGPVADEAPPFVEGEMPADILLTTPPSGGETGGALKTGWQLMSSLANASEVGPPAALPNQAAAPDALAALSEGVEETKFANLTLPQSARGDSTASEAPFPAMKVTVTGEETHFAPVQSAERALSRLLNGSGPVNGKGAEAASTDGAGATEGEDGAPESTAATALATAETPKPAAGLGSALDPRGGREGSRGERQLPEGNTTQPSVDQPGARAGVLMAAELHAAAASGRAAPSADAPPSLQIARRIAAELADPASRPATVSSSSDGAVKVLHLQLEPANLGAVTVRIALKDNVINLQVEASRHETAFAIEKDRELLSNALKSAGYLVDGISSQPAADPARPGLQVQAASNDGQMSSSLQSQSDSQSGLAQSGRGNQGGQGRQFSESGFAPASQVNEGRSEGTRNANGALYV